MLLCFFSIVTNYSCNEADLQKSLPNDQVRIHPRGECDLCSGDDECCCELILYTGYSNASLRLCGTANGVGSCSGSATGSCGAFSGGGQSVTLTLFSPKHSFCLDKNSPFWISNIGSATTSFYIICWDQLSTIDQEVVLLAGSSADYFFIDGNCDVEPCE